MGYIWLTKEQRKGGHRLEHRNVWESVHGKIPRGLHIHHINGKKSDNRIENLSLVTNKENHGKSDRWGKMYIYYPNKKANKYKAVRYKHYLGYFGTPGGAYMQGVMYHVNNT